MRISDWSSDVCSSDLMCDCGRRIMAWLHCAAMILSVGQIVGGAAPGVKQPDAFARFAVEQLAGQRETFRSARDAVVRETVEGVRVIGRVSLPLVGGARGGHVDRSEEHTFELQSPMRISYPVFCLTKITN